ncbi:MAG: hypothetical protein ABEJ34_08620 [Haloferacaceae archaeon]
MLSGRLPTGTVEDRPGDARRDDGRPRTERTERPDPREPGGTTERAVDADARADLAAENRRLRRRLAAERAERRAVIDRYERLLAERRETRGRTCGDAEVHERAVARVRRALSLLRRWRGRLRLRRG